MGGFPVAAITAATVAASVLIAWVAQLLFRRAIMPAVRKLTRTTSTTWDDCLLSDAVLHSAARVIPPIVIWLCLPEILYLHPGVTWPGIAVQLWLCVAIVILLCVFMRSVAERLKTEERFSGYPVQGVYQMLKLIAIIIGSVFCIGILLSRSPLLILSGLGASAAILSLVFKDTILGFVAGIQLSANKMLHERDWIIAPRFDANGEVETIGLTTVKVRNWDKSVTTIPTYALITESFQNWQRMRDFGARRVTRSFFIDVNSVRFCTAEQLDRLQADSLLDGIPLSEAGLTVNLGLLRRYLEHYLREHPAVSHRPDDLIMVRQLQPTPKGLPIELYFFTATVDWADYETIQADIFDHVYASVASFGLRIFQSPSGLDIHPAAGQ